MRRTKIVCTIGPASSSVEQLDRLAAAGMDVARLNFSHGTHAEHAAVLRRIREGEERWGRPVAILQDLQGPKIRLGTFGENGGRRVDLEPGRPFALSRRPCAGTAERAFVAPPESLDGVKVGDQVLMDDGMIQLRVEETTPDEVRCRVVQGGRVSDHKGLSLPRVALPVSCLTDKDRTDLAFGIEQGVDFVAISFVRSAADIAEVRRFLYDQGASLPIVAKLERQEVMANLPGILATVDAVMVARGDLGVDVPLEEVPHLQKEIIRQARQAKVPVIVATQMLESMVTHLRPTRAEVSDVATAIFDSADAVMLSAETASGRYPAEAVETMARIAVRAEATVLTDDTRDRRRGRDGAGVGFPEAVSDAAAMAARVLKAQAIVAFTQSGFSARLISHQRPDVPIIAFTPTTEVRRRLALSWGVASRLIRKVETTDEMVEEIESALLGDGSVKINDVIVIISGAPMWVTGTTNLMKLHRVGERR
jgi:pyruvate kinase